MGPPPVAVAGPVLANERSVDAVGKVTCVVADDELLAALGSVSLPVIVAVLVMSPAVAGAVALIVIVALAPLARLPTLQVTVPEAFVQPELADTKVTPAGRGPVTLTPGGASGPCFWGVPA